MLAMDAKLARSALAVLAALALCACAQLPWSKPRMQVQTQYDRRVDFARLHTWSWLPGSALRLNDPRIDDALLNKRIREAVMSELSARGFERKLAGTPDFFVAYEAGVGGKLAATETFWQHPYGEGWDQDRDHTRSISDQIREVDQGILLLDLIDPRTSRPVWHGSARAPLALRSDSERTKIERINEAVRRLLEGFPPPGARAAP